jgi:inward rectifier potassium channel
MAFMKKINTRAKTTSGTGFGNAAEYYGGRLINKDGSPNVKKSGIGFLERYSWYHSMLAMSGTTFFLVILLFFIVVNTLFAVIYYSIGIEHLAGMNRGSGITEFGEAFFFSAQTFTTVGYGRISPTGFLTSAVSSIQALIGLLSFAVATGLMYGRFSRPKAYLKFSGNALISPYKEGAALMFRLAPFKNATLTDIECKVVMGMTIEEHGKMINRFFPLDLELDKVNVLTLNWTLVHPISENSPLQQFTKTDFEKLNGEIIVFIKAFDDMFSNTVVSRTSYAFSEVVFGAKFSPMFHRDIQNSITVLDLGKLNEFEEAALPVSGITSAS